MFVGCGVGVVVMWAYDMRACVHVRVRACMYVLCVPAPVRMHTSIGYVDAPSLGLLVGEYVCG